MDKPEESAPQQLTEEELVLLQESLKHIHELLETHEKLDELVRKITSPANLLLHINVALVAAQIALGRPWLAARYVLAMAPPVCTIIGCANELTRRKNDSTTVRRVHDAIQIVSAVSQALSGWALAAASVSASDKISAVLGAGAVVVGGLGVLSFAAKMLGRRMDKKALREKQLDSPSVQ